MIHRTVFTLSLLSSLAISAVITAAEDSKSVDTEAYRRAVEKLNAKPSAEPAEIDRLRTENAQLKKEVESLRKQLEDAKARLADLTPANIKETLNLKMGMTVEEVQKIIGPDHPGTIESESENYMVIFYGTRTQYGAVRAGILSITATFTNGKLSDIDYRHNGYLNQPKSVRDNVIAPVPDSKPSKPAPAPAKPKGKSY